MRDDDIPPLRRPEDMRPVRSQADLWRYWRALMGPLGFSERLLWLQFLEPDGRVTPSLTQITELPRVPDARLVDNLMMLCHRVCRDNLEGGSVAVLLSRPGPAGITADERIWAQRLTDAAVLAEVPLWPVHVANDQVLVVIPPDDLVALRAAAG
ncbi:MAG: hypothetical protein ACR2JT_01895 [Nocardioidaceae bacterium]